MRAQPAAPIMLETDAKLNVVWWLMRLGLGAGALVAGADKLLGILTDWSTYVSPAVEALAPVTPEVLLRVAGAVELAIGVAILSRWTVAGARAMALWAVVVALDLALAARFWELFVGELEIALAAYALARLSVWRAATIANYSPPLVPPGALVDERS